jgi:hypothetical protein
LNWLQVLLSPSVRSLHAIIMRPAWPMEIVCDMLPLATSKSAHIDDLFISPRGFDLGSIRQDVDHFSHFQRHSEFFSCFTAFRELRSLRSNLAVLYPKILPVLGELPHLDTLLVGARGAPPLVYDVALRQGSFPSLRRLSLENVESPSWAMNLWSVKPLFWRLKDISIVMSPGWMDEPGFSEHWADHFLSRLCEHSPKLSELCIFFEDGEGETPVFLSHSQEPLRQLPLKELALSGAHFDGGCVFLSSAWPDIVALRCDKQNASLADLAFFARNLPNLKKLDLDLDMSGSTIPDYTSPLFPPSPRYAAFNCLSMDPPKVFVRTRAQSSKLAGYV